MMRKIILFMHYSIDGYVCGPNDELDWATMNDDEMGEYLMNDLQKTVDTVLIGRVLYQGFEQYWPQVPRTPGSHPKLIEFAQWLESTPKVVFSKTLKEVKWNNSRIAPDPIQEIKKLKNEPGGDMVIFGGAEIVEFLTANNLVDEFRFKLEPIVLGKGKPLFKNVQDRLRLKLIKEKHFEGGVIGVTYEVIR